MPVIGSETVAKNIAAFGGGFIKHINKSMEKVRDMLDKEITYNASWQDHNLSYLRKIGYPYAKRHGPHGMEIHDPYWIVHKQSGELLSAKRSGIEEGSMNFGVLKAKAFVAIDENIVPHVLYVIWGTSKMIPRNFMTESLNNVKGPAIKYLQDNLTDFVFKFKPVSQ